MSFHLNFALKILPFVLGNFLIIMAMDIDKNYYPIMNDFRFITLQKNISSIEIEGNYKELSECTFLGSYFVAIDNKNKETILKIERVNNRPPAISIPKRKHFGTRIIDYPLRADFKVINVYGYFKCHPFWIHERKMASFPAPPSSFDDKDQLIEANIKINMLEKPK